ncbi:SGNH/GDSL hydrolase family protein [Lentisphaera profundi]|uniref:SGNH/GDSL hydrolase family protein n=1 Tax=Lentisphaera profundi TaxID=1658616 RepID=A0ABY7VU70_9BACT|nr:SGNH/GDSL hydrolase family protein [Lentisphaera profundi]WDE97761.1 SGNH/GDSL hydrolase family protein [Lentisphaera profundi]
MSLYRLYIAIFICLNALNLFAAPATKPNPKAASDKAYVPEEGSAENKKKRKSKKSKVDPSLPMVLIIGDSISIGYTNTVRKKLKGKANISHNPGNAQGTTLGVEKLDSWIGDTQWDVIHFNWGLHDLKRVKVAGTSENSNEANDPQQADLAQYTKNLTLLVSKLKATNAKLIFATTTPFPAGVKPYRDPIDAGKYNTVAIAIMQKNDITVNDLYSAVNTKLSDLQKPKNVHFNTAGSAFLAQKVVASITAQLQ